MTTDCRQFHCNVDQRDCLEIEDEFDFMGSLGFELKGPNIERGATRIVALNRTQVREMITVLQKALGDK